MTTTTKTKIELKKLDLEFLQNLKCSVLRQKYAEYIHNKHGKYPFLDRVELHAKGDNYILWIGRNMFNLHKTSGNFYEITSENPSKIDDYADFLDVVFLQLKNNRKSAYKKHVINFLKNRIRAIHYLNPCTDTTLDDLIECNPLSIEFDLKLSDFKGFNLYRRAVYSSHTDEE